MSAAWTKTVKLGEIGRDGLVLDLAPDEAERQTIARQLALKSLSAFTARVTLKPWLDGIEMKGRFRGVVEQICGVSLDPFEAPVQGEIEVRVVPAGSPLAAPVDGGEVDLDLDAPDPPDVLETDTLDVAAYVVEHLALEIDPFPRKPGAAFDFVPPAEDESPFAILKKLQNQDPK